MSNNLPVCIIAIPFAAAFIVSSTEKIPPVCRKLLVLLGTLVPLILVMFLVKPVFEGQILTYWLGDWKPFHAWAVGIGLAIDPLSIFLGGIIAFTCFLSGIYSFRYMERDTGIHKYYTLFLILTGSMLAFVFSADLFNMYVFLEVMTFAAISLTAFREHKYQSIEASFKYLVTGTIGSSFVLLGIILLYSQTGTLNLAQVGMMLTHPEGPVEIFAFASFLTGFGVKAFLVPMHTWPPDAHMAAPSSISMLLSGVLSKTGVYGLIRILYFVYRAMGLTSIQGLMVVWGTVTMLVGVSMALMQHDYKRLLAFHSVSQIGYVITGLGLGTLAGITGGLYHLLNHVLFKCLLFLTAGALLHRTGTSDLAKLGGLGKRMPWTFAFFGAGALSISGIPPFNGFASKWMIYGATLEAGYYPITIIAILVSVLTLASFIKVMHSAFLGPCPEGLENITEVPASMLFPMAVLSLGCIITGIFPEAVINKILITVGTALFNTGKYDAALFGTQFSAAIPVLARVGFWQPVVWLATFFIVVLGLMVFFSFLKPESGAVPALGDGTDKRLSSEAKYEIFTGGEVLESSTMGADDLYWGIKKVFAPYFGFLRNAHSGVVNDYAMWVVLMAVILNIYLFLVF